MIFILIIKIQLCTPRAVYICDGSEDEAEAVINKLVELGTLTKLTKYENCYICSTDPRVRSVSFRFNIKSKHVF
jgi:phosphoenolpyruvate carboxykinase (GTP)